jgi:asparagine synthase (glutamine-hydrolysing)
MKPLYFAKQNGALVFSSELRGLFGAGVSRKLNRAALNTFFLFGYTPIRQTLIEGVEKVSPGSVRTYDLAGGTESVSYFGARDRDESPLVPTSEMLREMIGRSVEEHTMGLRPFGLFLSGGLDSSVILRELARKGGRKVATYTTRFDTKDGRLNEDADLAGRLAKEYGTDHREVLITDGNFTASFEETVAAMEEPRYNYSVPSYYLLAKEAAKDITVVLNGSGGDELFLGYPRYLDAAAILAKYERFPAPLLNAYHSLRLSSDGFLSFGRTMRLNDRLSLWAYLNKITPLDPKIFRFSGSEDMARAVAEMKDVAPAFSAPLADDLNGIAELDRWFWLANEEYLRTDKIIMHFGMEGRFPLLSREMVRLANRTPSAEKLKNGKKSQLREAYRGELPDYIIDKRKTGWNAPVSEWMKGEFGRFVDEVLTPAYHEPTAGLFDLEQLRKNIRDKNEELTKYDLAGFMSVVQFRVWAKMFRVELN